ncbi:hypothetical protein [Actinomadura rayongensis]|uniref:Uncharacterized protein n=1 Tax=Actinomadura rayongensis TaxID=1429076 RepID=A0A6I4WDI7_9ACTN|nr:hypothetical protein [Actinomadura rayongensis]MXQ67731.1 hypothetical protein [Actinomadura rayongensis]
MRLAYLAELAEAFQPMPEVRVTWAEIDGYAVLSVEPVERAGRTVTIGCSYERGHWRFCDAVTKEVIRPTSEVIAAANAVRWVVCRPPEKQVAKG